jgi:hypothetical protein
MNNCETYQNWMLEEELTADQKASLEAHLAKCAECRQVKLANQMIMFELTNNSQREHPQEDMLVRYVMFLDAPDEPDHEGHYFTSEELHELKQHITDCSICAKKVNEMHAEFQEMAAYVDASPLPDAPIAAPQQQMAVTQKTKKTVSRPGLFELFKSVFSFKNLLIPATGLAVVALLFVVKPFQNSNPYEQITDLGTPHISYLTRSTGTQLQTAIQLFNNGRFVESANTIEGFLNEKNSDAEQKMYARYVAGISWLFAAKTNHQNQLIDRADAHLTVVYQNSANLRLKENAGWYLAKAALLKKQPQQAAHYLQAVVKFNGLRAAEAKSLLDLLEKDLTKSE